jgi:hypothetical protein
MSVVARGGGNDKQLNLHFFSPPPSSSPVPAVSGIFDKGEEKKGISGWTLSRNRLPTKDLMFQYIL